jgi:hypothetical protein
MSVYFDRKEFLAKGDLFVPIAGNNSGFIQFKCIAQNSIIRITCRVGWKGRKYDF